MKLVCDLQLKDLKDKNIRLLAEMQNVRMIAKRDVQKKEIDWLVRDSILFRVSERVCCVYVTI